MAMEMFFFAVGPSEGKGPVAHTLGQRKVRESVVAARELLLRDRGLLLLGAQVTLRVRHERRYAQMMAAARDWTHVFVYREALNENNVSTQVGRGAPHTTLDRVLGAFDDLVRLPGNHGRVVLQLMLRAGAPRGAEKHLLKLPTVRSLAHSQIPVSVRRTDLDDGPVGGNGRWIRERIRLAYDLLVSAAAANEDFDALEFCLQQPGAENRWMLVCEISVLRYRFHNLVHVCWQTGPGVDDPGRLPYGDMMWTSAVLLLDAFLTLEPDRGPVELWINVFYDQFPPDLNNAAALRYVQSLPDADALRALDAHLGVAARDVIH